MLHHILFLAKQTHLISWLAGPGCCDISSGGGEGEGASAGAVVEDGDSDTNGLAGSDSAGDRGEVGSNSSAEGGPFEGVFGFASKGEIDNTGVARLNTSAVVIAEPCRSDVEANDRRRGGSHSWNRLRRGGRLWSRRGGRRWNQGWLDGDGNLSWRSRRYGVGWRDLDNRRGAQNDGSPGKDSRRNYD